MSLDLDERARRAEGQHDPYDAVWPEGSRVERGPLFPLIADEDRRADWLEDATVAFLVFSAVYTAGSAVYGLAKLAVWLVAP